MAFLIRFLFFAMLALVQYAGAESPFSGRVEDLLSRMTLEEKASQLVSRTPAIPRLGIPAFIWDNEGKHAFVSCFPASIGIAATWNPELARRIASAISDEARATHNTLVRDGKPQRYLCFWAPTVNMARDPRWGRVNETFGEDPFLTTRLAVPFIQGMQGNHPVYLKTAAGVNHFAVYSEERDRHSVDATLADERVLRDYYLPHFRACVIDGGAATVGATNNGFNGTPVCANRFLLTDILRREWGFRGFVFSDSASVEDLYQTRALTGDPAAAAAMTIRAGCEINTGLGDTHLKHLPEAVRRGFVTEEEVTEACRRVFTVRFRLGLFDPPADVPFTRIPESVIDSPAHRALAREAAVESIVLLRNEGGLLPLRADKHRRILVAGPRADHPELGRKQMGSSADNVSALEGIRRRATEAGVDVIYQKDPAAAVREAATSDVVVFLSSLMEGEVTDRHNLRLPPRQEQQIAALADSGRPVVVILVSGSCVDVSPWIDRVPAVLAAWYPGEEGGNAIAAILFGDQSPAGRLPITFYQNSATLPIFTEFDIRRGLTHAHAGANVRWPFGYGLSYTTFRYSNIRIQGAPGEQLTIEADVTNTGNRPGAEVAQLYITAEPDGGDPPSRRLRGFEKLRLQPGETRTASWSLTPADLAWHDSRLDFALDSGRLVIDVGGSAGDRALTATVGVPQRIVVRDGPRFTVSRLSLDKTDYLPGEPVVIQADVLNTGSITGRPDLTVDGELHPCDGESAAPGAKARLRLVTRLHRPGLHRVGLGDHAPVSIRVAEAPAAFHTKLATAPETVREGEATRFELDVTNTGGARGATSLSCVAEGAKFEIQVPDLDPGETRRISFSRVFLHPGPASLTIEGNPPHDLLVGTAKLPPGFSFFSNTTSGEALHAGARRFILRSTGSIGGSWIEENNGELAVRDEYTAVYQPGVVGRQCVVTIRIDHRDLVSNQTKAGIMLRNHIDQPGRSPGYVILGINGYFNGLAHLESDQDHDGYLDTTALRDFPTFPKYLRLERNGNRFRSFMSTDEGRSWIHFHTVHLKSTADRLDAGFFVASDSDDQPARVIFGDFTVEDGPFTGSVIEDTVKPPKPEQPY